MAATANLPTPTAAAVVNIVRLERSVICGAMCRHNREECGLCQGVIYSLERSQPMEPTKPKLPSEAIELYNLFIHGVISRRAFMDGVQKFAVGGLAAAAIIEALMPNYAQAQQVS